MGLRFVGLGVGLGLGFTVHTYMYICVCRGELKCKGILGIKGCMVFNAT